jgi:large subunit ribosomal protein L32
MVNHMRHTRSHTGNRRSHHALKEKKVSMCSECGAPKLNHAVCLNCGKYNGRVVVDVHAALAKKEKKMKERQKAAAGDSK